MSTPTTRSAARRWRKLVNRQRLLGAVDHGAPFQILIMRDASRFSRRDGDEAFGELKRLAQRGIEIWFYQDGTRFSFGSFGENVVGFVRAEMNAEFRRQIGKWTTEAMVRKAKAGHVTGGKVFGYDNVKVDGHTERRINESHAEVIRRIFALCASGTGYTRIAKLLNAERAPAPRPQQARPAGWSPSTVNEVLHRSLYRGEVVWNKTKKRDAAGRTAPTARPEAEWMRFESSGPAHRVGRGVARGARAPRWDSVAARDGEGRSTHGAPRATSTRNTCSQVSRAVPGAAARSPSSAKRGGSGAECFSMAVSLTPNAARASVTTPSCCLSIASTTPSWRNSGATCYTRPS